jgi:FAD/FMN-containing dehydrogenase
VERSLAQRLKAERIGDARFDAFTRGRYATDASHYQIMPLGVVMPDTIEEAERAISVCRAENVPVTPRGGGTSQAGQTVNEALVIDCSRHLNRIVEVDAAALRCVVDRSISLPHRARPLGAWWATIPAALARCATATRARM